jgi:hypothetical protein
MSRVFILNNNLHNYDKAKRFGELVNVTQGRLPIFKTDTVLNMVSFGLKNFTKDDYLLVSGPVLLNILATTILYEKFDNFKLLIFDAKKQDYVVRHITKENIRAICGI